MLKFKKEQIYSMIWKNKIKSYTVNYLFCAICTIKTIMLSRKMPLDDWILICCRTLSVHFLLELYCMHNMHIL